MNEVAIVERDSETHNIPAVREQPFEEFMIRAASDPNIDAAKVSALWEVQKEILEERRRQRQEEAEAEFYAAKAEVQAKLPIIPHDKKNPHTRSTYTSLEAMWEACCPIWTGHGFSVRFPSHNTHEGLIHIECWITRNGYTEKNTCPDAPADTSGSQGKQNKTIVQGNQSTISFTKRGLLGSSWGIVTRNDDDDGAGSPRHEDSRNRETHDTRSLREQAESGEFNRKPSPQVPPTTEEGSWIGKVERAIINAESDYRRIQLINAAADKAEAEDLLHQIAKLPIVRRLAETPDNKTFISAALGRGRKRLAQATRYDPPQQHTADGPFQADIFDHETGEIFEGPFGHPVEWATAFIEAWKSQTNKADREAFVGFDRHLQTIQDACKTSSEAASILGQLRNTMPEDQAQAPAEMEAVAIPLVNGRPDWVKYIDLISDIVRRVPKAKFIEWVRLQEPVISEVRERGYRFAVVKRINEMVVKHDIRQSELPAWLSQAALP